MASEETPKWAKSFFDLARELDETITTHQQFAQELNELLTPLACPIKRLCVVCTHKDRTILNLEVGLPAADLGNPKCWEQSIGPESVPVSLCVTYWLNDGGTIRLDHFRPIVALLESFLSIQNRKTGLLILDSKNRPEIVARLSKTLDAAAAEGRSQALVYVDLDNFKKLNDVIGHDAGDAALRDFEADILKISETVDVVGFSEGGDEYLLYFPNCDDFLVLSTLNELRKRVASRSYQGQALGMTAGVARPSAAVASLKDVIKRAEHATQTKGETDGTKGEKKRGTVSFDQEHEAAPALLQPETFTKLGVSILRSGCLHRKPFANQALNFLSHQVCDALVRNHGTDVRGQASEIDEVVSEVSKWLGLATTTALDEGHLVGPPSFRSAIPAVALGLCVSHGVLRASALECSLLAQGDLVLELQLCDPSSGCCVRDSKTSHVIWGAVAGSGAWVKVGEPIEKVEQSEERFFPLCLVLAIGLTHRMATPAGNEITPGMFAGKVVVDDRPYVGGGLPDFWQAAMANLIALRSAHAETAQRIIVLGDRNSAPETSTRLSGGDVGADELAVLAGCKTETVKEFLEWATKSVVEAADLGTDFPRFVGALYESSLLLTRIPAAIDSCSPPPSAKLPRALLEDGLQLPVAEGISCATAAQAYPAVLDRLRHSGDSLRTRDDAHQDMYELLGFKLLVENPGGELVPDYWRDQRTSMDAYANDVLIGETSKIGKYFHEDGQLDRFIAHLTGYFVKGADRASTRRAILIVPNTLDAEPKPLGLVSIWATPRHSAGQDQLAFCFVWRTVEALVGFPYSLYGSLKFAEHVVEAINARLGRQVSRIALAPLRYLALSLHMRTDEYHHRFAKRIVDAASD